ncbi:MAG: TRAP transporter substrate-binding protein [Deltaproteobacteria bacterium]|nr:TRAP transporter substrate-binding protein [Deltaproteobacteria bacterium]MBW1738824.1 TRAP transporter substrate-binding protein [Deltaproteobacteria bacterium]MBW1911356.1 TRAP transporter substrate-binding protein [Deltaproteobacteria bacterium]MBW2033384.1 TRAP transporter substrate-binding protein [Deltaproteobacteria bacterium]MBW2116193.1 TRAP transporter substrate-binding protein [Deltaproteobacteria bacterium]
MNAKRGILVFFLIMVLGVFFMFGANTAQAKAIELSYSNFFPPTHIQAKLGDSWAKEIEKRTKGKVKITYYPGGSLLKGPKIYDGVLKGISDIGMSVFAYSRGVFPSMEAMDLPMGYPNGKAATAIINDFYNKFKPKELSKVKVMYLHAHGPGLLHSKKVVNNMDDLKGLKVRATGFSAKVVKALGGVPVAMGQGGTYEALQKGVVDATFSPIEVLKGWKQGEVVKYTIECYSVGYTAGFYVAMNLNKWNALPKDVQKVILDVNKEWIAKHGKAWDDSDKAGREFTLSLGNKIIPLSKAESARWANAVATVFDGYINDKSAKGLPAKDYVDFIKAGVKKYSK